MKVRDLIDFLESCDPEAIVLLGTQPNYPFECSVSGAPKREDVWPEGKPLENGAKPNDVFILEGNQVRYGKKALWDAT